MNEYVLRGHLAKYMLKMGLTEVTHHGWGNDEPHTYFRGTKPIDRVWRSHQLVIASTTQFSFHEGVGDLRSVLVNITKSSAIGKQEFSVVHPNACRLSSGNIRARSKYISHLEQQMLNHRMVERLQLWEEQATSNPAPSEVQTKIQQINNQAMEMQQGSKQQRWQIFLGFFPFSKPVQMIYMRRHAYQELAKGTDPTVQ
jgi:hypothetical protein